MNVEEIFTKALGWYKGLTTWKKVVGFLFLAILLVLGIVFLVYRVLAGRYQPTVPAAVDDAHSDMVDTITDDLKEKQKKLEKDLLAKKANAVILAVEREKDAAKQTDITTRIKTAANFEEVDAILKGLK